MPEGQPQELDSIKELREFIEKNRPSEMGYDLPIALGLITKSEVSTSFARK